MPSAALVLRNIEKFADGYAHGENLTCGANQTPAQRLPRLEDCNTASLSNICMSSTDKQMYDERQVEEIGRGECYGSVGCTHDITGKRYLQT